MAWRNSPTASIALVLSSGIALAAPVPPPQAIPHDFTLATGERIDLVGLRGKVVIINIWATWCVPCRAEIPLLNGYYRRHRAEGLVVIGIAVDPGKAPGDQFVSGTIGYPQARHVFGPDLTVASVPTSYVFTRDGRLSHVESESFDAAKLARWVGPLLGQK